jgi:basic membrane lipoprotein Med (substrate-binding protein (PBP1-ABC) superfamily)
MSTLSSDAVEAYEKARKLGEKDYKQCRAQNKDANLPVLDEILKDKKTVGEFRIGIKEIPLHEIVGTKSAGRTESFAPNFMPLLPAGSEFAFKWINLYRSQMEEGLRDPILVYEYLHKYYVQEGNKRVSVMKYLNAPVIMASIIRVLPARDNSRQSKDYYASLDFQKRTHIDFLKFSVPECYEKIDQILGLENNVEWSKQQADDLHYAFSRFERLFYKVMGKHPKISASDAFYVYLDVYGFDDWMNKSNVQIEQELEKIKEDFEMFPNRPQTQLITEKSEVPDRKSLLSLRLEPLKVAFIHAKNEQTSAWTKKHESARRYVQELLTHDIKTTAYFGADDPKSEWELMEKAVKDGNQVIFTTSPNMLRSSIKLAAQYPKIKVLNCSLNLHTGHLRTYFARMYEVQFLFGMTAGILTQTNHIGYVADYPIYGMIANINAFALGVKMVNPRARIYLDWSTTTKSMLADMPDDVDITYIGGQEFDPQLLSAKEYGLYDTASGKYLNLALIEYYWGEFYQKIIKSILNHTYKKDGQQTGNESITYWYGLSNGMLDITLNEGLPEQTKRLIEVMKEHMSEGHFNLFSTEMHDQQGILRNKKDQSIPPEGLVDMDWLLDNIDGTIPKLEDFSVDAKRVVSMHGISKVRETNTESETAPVST